jgi:hypothetical protein
MDGGLPTDPPHDAVFAFANADGVCRNAQVLVELADLQDQEVSHALPVVVPSHKGVV